MEVFDILGYCLNFILIPIGFLMLLCILIDFNKMDYITKKILFVQIVFLFSLIPALYYFNIKFHNFIISIILLAFESFYASIISPKELRNPNL